MRTVFLLLVLANAAFFAYGWAARERAPAHDGVAALEVNADKIRLLKRGVKPAATRGAPADTPSGAPAEVTAAPAACIEWGAIAGSEVARADAAMAKLDLPQGSVQRTALNSGGYWVYLPPASSKAELDRTLAQLTASGISEFYVVQEATPWRNAVSLGIFKSEDAAKSFLATLHARGFASALAGRREDLLKQFAYFVREPDEASVARLAALQADFPGTRMQAVACPQPR